jgi:hypothetical protein
VRALCSHVQFSVADSRYVVGVADSGTDNYFSGVGKRNAAKLAPVFVNTR